MINAHSEGHRTGRIGWLRATVLGANDGIISTASLIMGIAAAQSSTDAIITAGVAGLVCARGLFGAHRPVTVFEKSRGLGGRLATRRIGRMAFDHGAQYVDR